MMLAAVINGVLVNEGTHAISLEDRGLAYGDGVFETMRLHAGRVRFLDQHLARLREGCTRLGFTSPAEKTLRADIALLAGDHVNGVIKVIVTHGAGGRGYRPTTNLLPTRVVILYPPPSEVDQLGVTVRWCATRLARNAQLAGIKHLNRLEQVLAQSEWNDPQIAEGLMLDTEGELVCATAGNLFIVSDGILATPDLRFSGVRGVMRAQVIDLAQRQGLVVEERAMRPDDLIGASEAFITNAVRGIRPIVSLDEHRWSIGNTTSRLVTALSAVSV
jgi:4-amino-4-deoxychorismate lyase